MRMLQAVLPPLRLYLKYVPTKRGRGAFTRLVRWGVAAGLKPPVVRTQVGTVMEFEPNLVGQSLLLDGIWEQRQTELLARHMKGGDVVLNIGANAGYYAILAGRTVGSGRVFAFDIQKEMCDLLERNCRLNGLTNVTVVNKGCWSSPTTAGLVDTEGYKLDAGEVYVDVEHMGAANQVDLVTVDGFARHNGIHRLDMMIVDTEGADFEVLKGAAGVIDKHRPSIMLEVHHLHRFGASEQDVREFLGRFDYQFLPIESKYSRDLFCTHPERANVSAAPEAGTKTVGAV